MRGGLLREVVSHGGSTVYIVCGNHTCTSAVLHENEHFINTRAGLIDSTTKVCDGILVAGQQFL